MATLSAGGSSVEAAEGTSSRDSSSKGTTRVVTLLHRLRAPKPSEFSRKRVINRNPPPKGKRRARGSVLASDPKSVSALQRVHEFENEQLTVSSGKLFCSACREELSLKKNVITSHVQSAKHKAGKSRLASKEAKERDIAVSLKTTDQQCPPVGETLPMDQRVYRVKVVKTFLRAAVPLNKIDTFRELLEENAFRLTDRRHMTDLVPFVLSQEVDEIKAEMNAALCQ